MKEKEKTLGNKDQSNEMISSNIFDDLFDKKEKEESSLFSGETSSQVNEENNTSKLTIADVFGTSTEKENISNSSSENQNLTIADVFGKEESLKEKEDTISSMQEHLPSVTITENTNDENVILKPIVSIQEQLPPITITNEEQIIEEINNNNDTDSNTIESIFNNGKKDETTKTDSDIQIGIDDTQSDSLFGEDSTFLAEENNTPDEANSEIDYFNYDFKDDIKENANNQSADTKDDFSFDFYNTIRPQENEHELNSEEEKIEFSKVFAQKDTSDDDDKIITINEDSGNEYRREKKINEYSLYIFYAFLAIVAIGLIIFFIQRKKDFSLSRDEITLALRSTYQAEIIANTKVQENTDYEWSSSDTDIATVDQNGVIAANNKGSATITVKSKKSNKKKTLAVTTIDIIINSIRFEKQNITVTEGDELTLSPIINDDKTIIMNLEWTSWNDNVVTVDQNGHIVAVNPGETSISVTDPASNIGTEVTVSVKSKKSNKKTNTNVNTNKEENKTISVSKVSLDRANVNMTMGETITVKATVSPSNATNKKISWVSSNPTVATVKNGEITAIAEGNATITVTTHDGNKKASMNVVVSKPAPTTIPVQGISLTTTSITMKVDDTKKIEVSITPNNANNKHVSWKVENTNDVIKITQNTDNQITFIGKKAGEAIITVTTHDGKYSATCKIKVVNQNTNSNTNSNSNSNTNSNTNSNSNSNDNSNSNTNDNSNSNSNENPTPEPTPEEN